ncbi:MAG: hypothetical protein V4642_12050 [Bacteroidota bacterium]
MRFLKITAHIFILATALTIVLSYSVSAQTETFKVLAKKGHVTVNSGGKSKDWQNIGTGFQVYPADKIKLEDNSYISLVYPANGRTIELKKAGIYGGADLIKQATAKINGVAGRYASYVGKELSKVNEPISPGDKHQSSMGNTGSVERAFGDEVTTMDVTESAAETAFGMLNIPAGDYAKKVKTAVETIKMKVPMPKSSYIIDSIITFTWHPVENATRYFVTLSDEEDHELFEIVAKDTFLTVDLSHYTLEKERCYNWHVSSESFPPAQSANHCIMRLPDNSFKSIGDTAYLISLEFFGEDTPLRAMTLGHFYEENSLFLNAMEQFRRASTLEPEIDEYRLAYARFLERIGLDDEAVILRKAK